MEEGRTDGCMHARNLNLCLHAVCIYASNWVFNKWAFKYLVEYNDGAVNIQTDKHIRMYVCIYIYIHAHTHTHMVRKG